MTEKKSTDAVPAETSEGTVLTPEQKRRLRARNIAVAAVLFGLIVLFYLITIFRMGGGVADRAI